MLKSKTNWEPEYDLEKAIPIIIDFEKKRKANHQNITKDPKVLNTLKTQLDRLNAIGGLKAVVPTEGITFVYKGKLFK